MNMAGRLGKKSTRKTNLFCATFLPISDLLTQFQGSFEFAQLCGVRAKFEKRSATFETPAQLSRTWRNFVITARNSCDGERNSFG